MNYISTYYSIKGNVRSVNQDSLLIMQAETSLGNILLASVCDGMGGHSCGEKASSLAVHALENWFIHDFPVLLPKRITKEKLWQSLTSLTRRLSYQMTAEYENIILGTTCTMIILIGDHYYYMNIGDSRIYLIGRKMWQITHDQTLVQQKIDRHEITWEESFEDPDQGILLQAIGSNQKPVPEFGYGSYAKDDYFLLTSDGFYHHLTANEIFNEITSCNLNTKEKMNDLLQSLTSRAEERNETDNITSILVKAYE